MINRRPSSEQILWLCAAMALVITPHLSRLPIWAGIAFGLLALWRLGVAFGRISLPARWLRVFLVLAILPAVYLSQGTLFGRSAGLTLLAALAGMKLLETQSPRDAYVVTLLGFFLVITHFLYQQSIAIGIYMLLVVIVFTATLMTIHGHGLAQAPIRRLRYAGILVLQAMPIALLLFLLFPRLPGPLWGLPKDAYSTVTGLGETMSPGSVSRLSLSDAVAFRVKFDGPPPPAAALYWRGPVLWTTDGRTWSGLSRGPVHRLPDHGRNGTDTRYTVTLEPHNQRWLFALDLPASTPRGSVLSEDFQLLRRKRIRQRLRYRARSRLDQRPHNISAISAARALALPQGAHPTSRALAKRWRRESRGEQAYIQRVLAHFRQQPFYYTLRPPLLGGDTVDEFMFSSRRGFCEHYAAAFTVFMRAAGIPARIVTGYQGGEYNPLGQYLVVRQRDAHAWVELWLEGSGWVRVDPTAAVSPSRIELGMDAAIPQPLGPPLLGLADNATARELWRNFRQSWDALNNGWNQWVLGYGMERQRQLLARIHIDSGNLAEIALALMLSITLSLGILALWLWRRRAPGDPVLGLYRRFCQKLKRRHIECGRSEGPVDFCRRITRQHPQFSAEASEISRLYIDLRYGSKRTDISRLRQAVKIFHP